MLLHRTIIIMNRMREATRNMKVEDMSTSTTIIIMGDLLVEVNSLEVGTTYHDDQCSVSHVTMKVTDMHNIYTKTGPT